MIVNDYIEIGQKPTEEQIQMVKLAAAKPVEFDEDCPELTTEQIKAFQCAVRQRNRIKKEKCMEEKM